MPIPDFSNTTTFPVFEDLPFDDDDGAHDAREEWFLVAQVKQNMTITKPTVVAADRGGDEFAITFEDRGIDLRPVKTGWSIVVPRAMRTRPREGKKGFVRVAEGRGTGVKYVPAGLEVMFELGRMVRGEDEEEKGAGRCAGCGMEEGLKSFSTYATPSPSFIPLPRNGQLGAADPVLAPILAAADTAVAPLWHPDLSLEEFRSAWLVPPPAPLGTPREGVDVVTETRMVPMRDGVEREVKIWRARTGRSEEGEDWKEEKPGVLAMRFHGGGWVVGGHVTEEPENLMLAGLGGVVVVSVDYRTAPEHKFPIPLDDCLDATLWCQRNAPSLKAGPDRIILLGSSGGANLALAVSLRLREGKVDGVIAQALAFPVTCHPSLFPSDRYEYGSWQQHREASVLDAVKMEWFWDAYITREARGSEPVEWHSPLLAGSFEGLAACLDEGIALAERMREEGVPTEMHAYRGMPHCFYIFEGHEATTEYYRRVVDFVKAFAHGSAEKV
ncbi:lipase esterase [Colletotrichum sojae]|uniref:Lipase esterase n=2 Tax=Colletotrichum orchidearum species complex TaxID=2707337 RepID=A0A8H6MJN5_9PEZI|nr:lipase esterase [Colletotrichum sojae]